MYIMHNMQIAAWLCNTHARICTGYPHGRIPPYSRPAPHPTLACRAAQLNGVPQVTTCTVTWDLGSSAVPTFVATGLQGVLGTDLNQELRTAFSDSYTPQE